MKNAFLWSESWLKSSPGPPQGGVAVERQKRMVSPYCLVRCEPTRFSLFTRFFAFFLFSCYSFCFVLPKRNWPLNRIVYWDDKNMKKYTTGVLTWRQLSCRDCLSLFVSGEKYKLVSYVQLNERSTVRRDLCDKGLWRGRSIWLREGERYYVQAANQLSHEDIISIIINRNRSWSEVGRGTGQAPTQRYRYSAF